MSRARTRQPPIHKKGSLGTQQERSFLSSEGPREATEVGGCLPEILLLHAGPDGRIPGASKTRGVAVRYEEECLDERA